MTLALVAELALFMCKSYALVLVLRVRSVGGVCSKE